MLYLEEKIYREVRSPIQKSLQRCAMMESDLDIYYKTIELIGEPIEDEVWVQVFHLVLQEMESL